MPIRAGVKMADAAYLWIVVQESDEYGGMRTCHDEALFGGERWACTVHQSRVEGRWHENAFLRSRRPVIPLRYRAEAFIAGS